MLVEPLARLVVDAERELVAEGRSHQVSEYGADETVTDWLSGLCKRPIGAIPAKLVSKIT